MAGSAANCGNHHSGQNIMEAERINLIGNQLVDLSNRVNELRGYL